MITPRQREMRRGSIGSSDVPKILGVSKWGTPADAYWSIVEPSDSPPTAAMDTGNTLEPLLVSHAVERFGLTRGRRNVRRVADWECPAHANLDWQSDDTIVEAKYISAHNADAWGDPNRAEVPPDVYAQCLHQSAVTGICRVIVVAGIARFTFEMPCYVLMFDDPDERARLRAYLQRWYAEHIATRTPPGPDMRPPLEVLRRVARQEREIELPAALEEICAAERAAAESAKQAGEAREDFQRTILAALGDATVGRCGRFTVRVRTQRSAPRADFARLRADGLFDTYCTQGEHSVVTVKANKEADTCA